MRYLLILIASLWLAAEQPKDKPKLEPCPSGSRLLSGECSDPQKVPAKVELTVEQKLKVREAQVKVLELQQQMAALVEQYKKTEADLKKATEAMQATLTEVTPKGFLLQSDMSLKAEAPKQEPAKPQVP